MNKGGKINSTVPFALLLLASNFLYSQEPVCTEDDAFKAFDSWVGEWDVSNKANGNLAGRTETLIHCSEVP